MYTVVQLSVIFYHWDILHGFPKWHSWPLWIFFMKTFHNMAVSYPMHTVCTVQVHPNWILQTGLDNKMDTFIPHLIWFDLGIHVIATLHIYEETA